MVWAKTTARRDEKHLSFGIWWGLYLRFDSKRRLSPAPLNWIFNGSDNSLSPIRRQVIIWTNDDLPSIGSFRTNLSDIWINKKQNKHFLWTRFRRCRLQNGGYFFRPLCVNTTTTKRNPTKLCVCKCYGIHSNYTKLPYSCVTWASRCLKSILIRLLVQGNNKKTSKAPHCWPSLLREH